MHMLKQEYGTESEPMQIIINHYLYFITSELLHSQVLRRNLHVECSLRYRNMHSQNKIANYHKDFSLIGNLTAAKTSTSIYQQKEKGYHYLLEKKL